MADSGDDEYDRKRRDKFRGERAADAAYSSRGSERAVRTRDDWPERDGWSRPRPRDYAGRVRDRGYSPSIEPAMKRPRTDYYAGGGGDYFGSGGGFAAASAYHPVPHRREIAANQVAAATGGDSGSGQPPMLSFKAFLATQDDNISDSEAIEKYNDYKLEFQRQQLNEFFVAHKDDEWFRIKYHPDDSAKRKEEQGNFIKKRVGIFEELFKEGRLSTSLDCVHTNALVKLLDTVVIKLEGGGEEDIATLDKEYEEKEEPRVKDKEEKKNETDENQDVATKNNDKEDGEDGELEDDKKEDNKSDADEKDSNENVNGEDIDMHENTKVDDAEDSKVKGINKNKGEHNNLDSDDGMEKQDLPEKVNIECEEQVEEDLEENIEEIKDQKSKDGEEKEAEIPKAAEDKNKDTIRVPKDKKRKRSRSFSGSSSSSSSSGSGSSSESETDNEKVKDKEKDNDQSKSDEAKEKTNVKKNNPNEGGEKGLSNIDDKVLNTEKDNATDENEEDKSIIVKIKNEDDKDKKEDKRPPPLHKTTSIFLRSLAPSITRQEVEAMCSRYAGFLRVALADPQPERRWQRRGWVTFRRDANIKEICWALNNARLRDCDLGAIMNRDLSRRIRPVSGIAAHRSVVRMDIRVSARVAVHMDDKYGLWRSDGEQDEASVSIEKEEKFTPFGFLSRNPVLHNITDYLIEEASAEEDLLLGLEPTGGDDIGSVDGTNVQIERDDALISVLDRIVLYLRIVHSIDYYNHCEYPNEDEMPSRCGILHARGPTPTARADITHLLGTQAESRMANFLPEVASANDILSQGGGSKQHDNKKSDNEHKLITLAMKDVDGEIDKFVQANTRELAKDKWLCPLSGKKFKGPDFVRKHIFNKHAEKIEEVKKEVEFFNNYLKDVKRPASADQHQHQQQQQQQQQAKRDEMPNNSSLGGYLGGGHQPQQSYGGYGGGGYMGGRYGGGGYGGYSRPHRGGYAHRARGGAAGGTATDYRPIIHYRDLDAPREPEEFI